MSEKIKLMECAKLLNVTPQYIKYYINTGRFPQHVETVNGRKKWLKQDVVGWWPTYKRTARA